MYTAYSTNGIEAIVEKRKKRGFHFDKQRERFCVSPFKPPPFIASVFRFSFGWVGGTVQRRMKKRLVTFSGLYEPCHSEKAQIAPEQAKSRSCQEAFHSIFEISNGVHKNVTNLPPFSAQHFFFILSWEEVDNVGSMYQNSDCRTLSSWIRFTGNV